jgi:hypothetical protein
MNVNLELVVKWYPPFAPPGAKRLCMNVTIEFIDDPDPRYAPAATMYLQYDPSKWRYGDGYGNTSYIASYVGRECERVGGFQLPNQWAYQFDDCRGAILATHSFLSQQRWNELRLDPRAGGPWSYESLGLKPPPTAEEIKAMIRAADKEEINSSTLYPAHESEL